MFFSLVFKEIKTLFSKDAFSKDKILNLILNLIVSVFFIAIEISLYTMLNNKLMVYKGASISFLTIFLGIISVVMIIYNTIVFRNNLFNEDDSKILITKPVDPIVNVFSKIIFTYVRNIFRNLLLATPILIVFGIANIVPPRFYLLMVLYPVFISLFECGVSCLLVLIYQPLYKFLKKHYIIQSLVSILIILGLCLGYSYVLNLFLLLVQNNSIQTIFTTSTIESFSKVASYLIPIKFYMNAIQGQYIGILMTFIVGIAAVTIGTVIVQFLYRYYVKKEADVSVAKSIFKRKPKILSVRKMLLKKEFQLLFNSSEMFSYTGLFVMQPFLTVLIINAMNVIFKTGALSYVISYFPYLNSLIHIVFVLLFSGYINTSCSGVISKEGPNGIRICKTIPVSYKEQILIKLIVPLSCSICSLIITCLSLLIMGQITFVESVYSFSFAIVLDLLLEIILVSTDLNNNESSSKKANNSSYIELVSIFLPIIIIALMFGFSYIGLPTFLGFLIILLLLAAITIIVGYFLLSRISKKFLLLEMRN